MSSYSGILRSNTPDLLTLNSIAFSLAYILHLNGCNLYYIYKGFTPPITTHFVEYKSIKVKLELVTNTSITLSLTEWRHYHFSRYSMISLTLVPVLPVITRESPILLSKV